MAFMKSGCLFIFQFFIVHFSCFADEPEIITKTVSRYGSFCLEVGIENKNIKEVMKSLERSFEMPLVAESLPEEQVLDTLAQSIEKPVHDNKVSDWFSGREEQHTLINVWNRENQLLRKIESIPVVDYESNSSNLNYPGTYPRDVFYFDCNMKLVEIEMYGDMFPDYINTRNWEKYGLIQKGWSLAEMIDSTQVPVNSLEQDERIAYCRLKSHIIKALLSTDIYKQFFQRLKRFVEEYNLLYLETENGHFAITICGPMNYVAEGFDVDFIHSDGKDRSDLLSQAFISRSRITRVAPLFYCRDHLGKRSSGYYQYLQQDNRIMNLLTSQQQLLQGFPNHLTIYTGAPLHVAEPYREGMALRYLTSVLFELCGDFTRTLEENNLKEIAFQALWDGYMND